MSNPIQLRPIRHFTLLQANIVLFKYLLTHADSTTLRILILISPVPNGFGNLQYCIPDHKLLGSFDPNQHNGKGLT